MGRKLSPIWADLNIIKSFPCLQQIYTVFARMPHTISPLFLQMFHENSSQQLSPPAVNDLGHVSSPPMARDHPSPHAHMSPGASFRLGSSACHQQSGA